MTRIIRWTRRLGPVTVRREADPVVDTTAVLLGMAVTGVVVALWGS